MITNWYHKEVASNRLLNYFSAHPRHMKANTVKNFIRKVFCLSHRDFWAMNIKKIKEILWKNNYPQNVIKKLICSVEQEKKTQNNNANKTNMSYAYLFAKNANTSSNNNKTSSYASMTYVPSLSERVSKVCKQFTPNLQLAFKSSAEANNKQFFKNLKTPLSIGQKSDVVYKIDCKNCNAVYIGETTQKLAKRIKQHENDSKTEKNKENLTALAKHARINKHEFQFQNTKILKTE